MTYDPTTRRAALGLAILGPFSANRRRLRPLRPTGLRRFLRRHQSALIFFGSIAVIIAFLSFVFIR